MKKKTVTTTKVLDLLENIVILDSLTRTIAKELEMSPQRTLCYIAVFLMQNSKNMSSDYIYSILSNSQKDMLDDISFDNDQGRYTEVVSTLIDFMNQHTDFEEQLQAAVSSLWGERDDEIN